MNKIRRQIYERDKATCQVCGRKLNWNIYECGHIVDRVVGGSNELTNLMAMCLVCNRIKPIHKTKEEFAKWRELSEDEKLTNPMRHGIKLAFLELSRAGCIPTGLPPIGLRPKEVIIKSNGTIRHGRMWEPDPETWPQVLRAWQMRLAGDTLMEIHRAIPFFVNSQSWSKFFRKKAYLNAGACTQEEWNVVQAMSRPFREGGAYPRRKTSPYLLSSPNFRVLCAYCGGPISGSSTSYMLKDGTHKRWRYYICAAKKRQWANCEARALRADALESIIINALLEQTSILDSSMNMKLHVAIDSQNIKEAKKLLGLLVDKIILARNVGEIHFRPKSPPIARVSLTYP